VKAGKVLTGGGVIEDGEILIEDGIVRSVGVDLPIPEGVPTIVHAGTISAGLIACHSYTGAAGETDDLTRAFLPEARFLDAYDPGHLDFGALLESGITSVVLAPGGLNVAGGLTAVVKSAGGVVLSEEAHLALSLAAASQHVNRRPTSAGGAMLELDQRLAAGEGAFGRAARGELPVLIDVGPRHEVQRALELAGRHGLQGALYGASLAGEMAPAVRDSGLAVICRPLDLGRPRRELAAMVALAEAGVPLAFGLDSPRVHPERLRLSAALLVREGLEPARAWEALTSGAAEIAGVGKKVGGLEPGMQADFVLWSGDPLELSSRPGAVFIDGKRVLGGCR